MQAVHQEHLSVDATETATPDAPSSPGAGRTEALSTHIFDGDTCDVLINGQIYRVRYILMNTPKTGEPFGGEATAANAARVADRTVMDAQARYLKCLDETGRDVHRLDGDGDGAACEWND